MDLPSILLYTSPSKEKMTTSSDGAIGHGILFIYNSAKYFSIYTSPSTKRLATASDGLLLDTVHW